MAVPAVCLVVLLAVPAPAHSLRSVPGSAVAAERIDLSAPAAPVRVIGQSGDLAADGDRAVAAVLADLQDFWIAQIAAAGGPALRPPAGGYVSMDSTASIGSALCISDPAQIAGNAFYCPQGDGIVFDSAALVPVLLGAYGSAGLAAAFAHEFGHAVQAQIGPTPQERQQDPGRYPSILIEAQADCDAGAFLAWASSGNTQRLHLPPSSLVRAVAPLLDFRDAATVSPADPTAHGLGLDRLSFLLVGFRGGSTACPAMTRDDLPLTLGRPGVTTGPPSTLPRFSSTEDVLAAARTSVGQFSAGVPGAPGAVPAPDPADLALSTRIGQFAAAAAVAIAAGQASTGTRSGATCFTGAWTASVFGKAGADTLGSWPTDADEAMDLIRSRPGVSFDELAAYADGFHRGPAACG